MKIGVSKRGAWRTGTVGVLFGLFLARLVLEGAARPWPPMAALTMGVAAAGAGAFLLRPVLQRVPTAKRFIGPVAVLLVYVIWPHRDQRVAAVSGCLAALLWLVQWGLAWRPSQRTVALVDGGLFLGGMMLYVATVAPDVLPADAGEFQLVAALAGVAHPPGYPLYTLAGYVWTHLFSVLFPHATPAYALNLMSCGLAAGTLLLLARATRTWAESLGASRGMAVIGGLAAALALGTATTFWAQATIANIRTPTAFFAAWALDAMARFAAACHRRDPTRADRALISLAMAFGLGITHHPSLAFVGVFFGAYVLLTEPRLAIQPRRWLRPMMAASVGLLPLLYLPIRGAMEAPLAPAGLDTWPGFLHHVLARGFAGDMFAFLTPVDLPHRLALVPTLFAFQFNSLLIAVAMVCLVVVWRRDWRLAAALTAAWSVHTLVTVTYRAPQTVEYLMPAYLPLAVVVGLGPALWPRNGRGWRSWLYALPAALALWGGLLNGWAHADSFIALHADQTARRFAQPLLETAPEGALILADWRWAMPLRYLQAVEGRRPDVEIQYVWPVAGREYDQVWEERVRTVATARPILLTHFYTFDGWTTEPWETGFRVHPRPVTAPQASLTALDTRFGEQLRLIGYDVRRADGSRFPAGEGGHVGHAGETLEFTFAWQPLRSRSTDSRPSLTLRLVDDAGRDRAQVDRALDEGCTPDEVCFVRLTLPLLPGLPAGAYRVTLGAYTVTESGFESWAADNGQTAVVVTGLTLTPVNRPPLTLHGCAIPFGDYGDGPTLVGVDYDRSVPDHLRVYLHWRGPADGGLIRLQTKEGEGREATVSLPAISPQAYQTVVVDVPISGSVAPRMTVMSINGEVMPAAGPWGWTLTAVRLPRSSVDDRFVLLGEDIVWVGAQAHTTWADARSALMSLPDRRQVEVVDVTFIARRPMTADVAISVRLLDAQGQWLAVHDYQPALGAIPTLKWIRGSRVVDRHLLPLPADFTTGEVCATLIAYERFRLPPLPVMDTRFGDVPLGAWTVP